MFIIPKKYRHYRVTTIVLATMVGLGLGVAFALRALHGVESLNLMVVTAICGVLGAIIANLLLLIDVKPGSRTEANGGTVVKNFIAVLALICCIIPYVGVALSVISFAMNRKVGGWQRTSAIACLILSLAVSLVLLGLGLVKGFRA